METLSHDPKWFRAGGWGAPDPAAETDLMIVGVPTWRTSLSPTNTGVTPDAIREALKRYSTHAVDVGAGAVVGSEVDAGTSDANFPANSAAAVQRELHNLLTIADAGDIDEPDLDEESAITQLCSLSRVSKLLVALGGDNALTVPVALGAARDDISTAGLITLDAHHDLRDGRSNGSPVRRLVEAGVDPRRIVQVGIADFANSKPYRDLANELGITVIHRTELLHRSMNDVMREALDVAGAAGGPIHVDLDVDVCDRSVAPACPASIPGGLSAIELRIVARVAGSHHQVRSIDIAEIDATADSEDGRTVRLAAQLVLEAALGLSERS